VREKYFVSRWCCESDLSCLDFSSFSLIKLMSLVVFGPYDFGKLGDFQMVFLGSNPPVV